MSTLHSTNDSNSEAEICRTRVAPATASDWRAHALMAGEKTPTLTNETSCLST